MSTEDKKVIGEQFIDRLGSSRLHRRSLVGRAGVAGIGAALAYSRVGAQDGTPGASPAASPTAGQGGTEPGTQSITLAEFNEQLREAYPFEEAQQTGGTVIFGQSSNFRTFNGTQVSDATSGYITSRVFESLIGDSPVDGSIVPRLAEYWELAEDGVTYTFHIHPNARWHDGTDVTADDVVFSYDSTLNPDIGSAYLSSVELATESYRAVDPKTFEVVSKGRLANFLYDSPSLTVVPKHIWESVPPAEWANDPGSTGLDPSRVVGSGAFRFQEFVDGDFASVVRNDDYYDVVPTIDEFVVRVLPDSATTVQALRTGEIDMMDTVNFAEVEEVNALPEVDVAAYPTLTFWYYIYNLDPAKTTLFQDPLVRQALFWAVDRQSIVDAITFGFAEVAQGTEPKLSIAYAPDRVETQYTYDPERAAQLLADAGWVAGDDGILEREGERFAFEWICPGGIGEYEQMLATIQESWRQIGVEMTPNFLDFSLLLEALDARDFEMANLAFSWAAGGGQGPMFRCDSIDGGFNYAGYCNPEYDAIDEQQRQELDRQARIDLLIQAENIVNEDLPVGIILFRDQRVGYSTRAHNFFPTGFGGSLWSLPFVWVEQ